MRSCLLVFASPAGKFCPPGQQTVPALTDDGRGSAGNPPRLIAGRASSILFTWFSSGTALAKPNCPTTGVPSGRPVQIPIR